MRKVVMIFIALMVCSLSWAGATYENITPESLKDTQWKVLHYIPQLVTDKETNEPLSMIDSVSMVLSNDKKDAICYSMKYDHVNESRSYEFLFILNSKKTISQKVKSISIVGTKKEEGQTRVFVPVEVVAESKTYKLCGEGAEKLNIFLSEMDEIILDIQGDNFRFNLEKYHEAYECCNDALSASIAAGRQFNTFIK